MLRQVYFSIHLHQWYMKNSLNELKLVESCVMERHREISLEVENGMGGVGKLKILRLLMKSPDHAFTRYEIGKTVPNDPTSIRRNLKTLVQMN